MLHAVIMAGGSGTRFWPESVSQRPKQLLTLVGDRSLVQQSVDRLSGFVPADRVLIVTNQKLVDAIGSQLPELPRASIIGEPCKRDTAPCIGLAAMLVMMRHSDPEATMLVMPSDHVIQDVAAFQQAVRLAEQLVAESPSRIVTFGVRPTYPAESFGYIERGERIAPPKEVSGAPVYRVRQFKEKPKADVARQYVESGNFYWNSGIFVWKAATILDALEEHQPELAAHLERIAETEFVGPDYLEVLNREFMAIRSVSIDYAVMEKAEDVVVIEAPFDWDDVGSWQAIARLGGTDADGNTIAAKHVGLRTTGSVVRASDNHLVVTLGIKDCIVVHTPQATLVANKHDEESIRQLVKLMEEQGLEEYL